MLQSRTVRSVREKAVRHTLSAVGPASRSLLLLPSPLRSTGPVRRLSLLRGNYPVTARTVQGMARARSEWAYAAFSISSSRGLHRACSGGGLGLACRGRCDAVYQP